LKRTFLWTTALAYRSVEIIRALLHALMEDPTMTQNAHTGSHNNRKTSSNDNSHNRSNGGFEMVVLAASAGGINALGEILSALPDDFPIPVAIVQHRSAKLPSLLARVLGRRTKLGVKTAIEGERLHPGTVYLAPPDKHLVIRPDQTLMLSDGHKIRYVLSSANPLFTSAAEAFHGRVIAVVLTGGDADGTDGVQSVKAAGGVVIAQNQATSEHFAMPKSAIATGCVDYVLPLEYIAPTLLRLVKRGHKMKLEV
jgi:two-component system chemotaxis response regulator CheB